MEEFLPHTVKINTLYICYFMIYWLYFVFPGLSNNSASAQCWCR